MKIKKLFVLGILGVSLFSVTSCDKALSDTTLVPTESNEESESTTKEETITALGIPNVVIVDNKLTWDAIPNAAGYVVKVNGVEKEMQKETSYTLPEYGNYKVYVKAISSDYTKYSDSSYSAIKKYNHDLEEATLWVLGDSTSCSFENESADQLKYYPRYGYGTQLSNYFDESLNVNNIAVSGRSSGSYFTEASSKVKYEQFKTGIKEGDFVIIAFGHNDQNSDERYSNCNLSSTDTTKMKWTGLAEKNYPETEVEREISFKYLLTHYYIDVALDAKATPILATPIVRRNPSADTLTPTQCHVWEGKGEYVGGDYAQCIRDLAKEKNVTLIDNTAITKAKYEEIGKDETLKMHAWVTSNSATVDNTHLNIYGAKWVAYNVAKEILKTDLFLKNYVKTDIEEPTIKDLVVNPNYEEKEYAAPTTGMSLYTTTSPWMASAFGFLGSAPSTSTHKVTESANNVTLQVLSNKGKIASSADGILMYYQQLSATSNFTLTATMTVKEFDVNTQVGFGIMIRDDMYVDVQTANNSSIASNYVACGSVVSDASNQYATAYRKATSLTKGSTASIAKNTPVTLTIVKTGNKYELTYGNMAKVEYELDLTEIDSNYVYAGFYVARNATVEFSNYSIK